MHHVEVGRAGEARAARFLRKKGFRIREQDYRVPFAQIDIIAEDDGTIVFVEVKTRRNLSFGLPQESVTRKKQEKLIRAAEWYLASNQLTERECRFDVLTVYRPGEKTEEINLIKNAFP